VALAIADSNGIKRICTNCGTRYYDMGKTPVTCPSCDTEYVGQVKPKVIESLDADKKEEDKKAVDVAEKKDDADEDEDEVIVSLDDLEEDLDDDDDIDEATALDNGDVTVPKSTKSDE
tara:strand:+ start:2643 stop:2996 length:354 start_codon:yes stop_codon:yes gene_type:complete